MATGDLDYLRLQLAGMVSTKTFALLSATEQADADAVINQAYRECYSDRNGKRPKWATKPFAYRAPAQVTFTATLTQGATSLGTPSATPDVNFAGSYVKIGERWFTYAGLDGSTHRLVEPWPDATGVQTLVMYHNSRLLPTDYVDICEKPAIVGRGKLMPMQSQEAEMEYRSGYRDFGARPGAGYQSQGDYGLSASMETGNPLWYYVDATSVGVTYDARHRICLYPLPDTTDRTITSRYYFIPALLSSGATMPELPADVVVDILLPIARALWAMTCKRYAGTNVQALVAISEQARERLDGMRVSQRRPLAPVQSVI